MKPRIGLVLTGGGARAAYQVGVLKAIAEFLPAHSPIPFRVICGTSAGAINATSLACRADNFQLAVAQLARVWERFHTHYVFRTETRVAIANGLRWFFSLILGESGKLRPIAILDNMPLSILLEKNVKLRKVQDWIDAELIDAVGVTTAAYYSGLSVTFYQGRESIRPWKRTRRIGIPRPLTINHLMASSAIPILFPAVRIGNDYYGDGSMRQMAPLSSALHLGAESLLVIGSFQMEQDRESDNRIVYPSLGQISGYILDTLFMDSLSMDIERLKRINHTLQHIPVGDRHNIPLRPIELLTIFPSEDIRPIVERHIEALPKSVRYLLGVIGAMNAGGRPLMSYLLFEGEFCSELMELGYRDATALRSKIIELLTPGRR